jgi:uncharacterized membrane protein
MSRPLLGATFLAAGALHILTPRVYEAIMPRYLPAHRELVYAGGVAEALLIRWVWRAAISR